ncbi:MAG: 5-formyltetrahydrofolate cyclo-ligase [Chloroflexi bacterium]|nr:5-formyltetrahydrofolate cyclo-ligase [Chloroflexota bacterium]
MSKSELRRTFRASRASLPLELVDGWSTAICARVNALEQWQQTEIVHCYVGALPGEVQTERLIEGALRDHKRVICPRIRPHGQLDHREVTELSQLTDSAFGLREPDPELCPPADPASADIVVVPGIAFSADGHRLGMGGGYYDRFLSQSESLRIALVYEMQLVDTIPRAHHDEPVDLIVTELRVVKCR